MKAIRHLNPEATLAAISAHGETRTTILPAHDAETRVLYGRLIAEGVVPEPYLPPPEPPRLVRRRVIIDRLHAAGKLAAARAALDGADLYTRERWNSRDAVLADDPTLNAMLVAIGADTAAILAP